MSELYYRAMLAADYPDMRALWKSTPGMGLSSADDEAPVASFLRRNPGCSFVCLASGRVAGTVLAGHDGRRGYLYHLAVLPEYRRRGIGSELLRLATSALRSAGIKKAHAFVFADNEAGKAFWAKRCKTRSDIVLFSAEL
jgi:N-acetylglutamate synthase